MPNLTVTWTRTDVNTSWPGEQGMSSNVVASEGCEAAALQSRANFQVTKSSSESADGLTKTVVYSGLAADLQDYFQSIQSYFLPTLDDTEDLFGVSIDVRVEPDLADTFPQYPT